MALFIKTRGGLERQWHLGQQKPYRNDYLIITEEVAYIQADGDELERIQYLFGQTIPMTNQIVGLWSGDLARTILLNL